MARFTVLVLFFGCAVATESGENFSNNLFSDLSPSVSVSPSKCMLLANYKLGYWLFLVMMLQSSKYPLDA